MAVDVRGPRLQPRTIDRVLLPLLCPKLSRRDDASIVHERTGNVVAGEQVEDAYVAAQFIDLVLDIGVERGTSPFPDEGGHLLWKCTTRRMHCSDQRNMEQIERLLPRKMSIVYRRRECPHIKNLDVSENKIYPASTSVVCDIVLRRMQKQRHKWTLRDGQTRHNEDHQPTFVL